MQKGEPRLALWNELKQSTSNASQILNNSKTDSFELRPYTQTVECWEFPQFYPEKEMMVPVDPGLDDDFFSFARCIKVSELVGIDCVEHYFPNRVALQFGILQDVPFHINRNNLSQEAAWNDYSKPIDDLTLYIPSRFAIPRVTPKFCDWRRASFQEFKCSSEATRVVETALTFQARNIKVDDTTLVPSGSKSRTSGVGIKIVKDSTKRRGQYMKQARDKRQKNMKRVPEYNENNIGCCQTHVRSDNDKEDDSLTIASEPLDKKSGLEADNNDLGLCQKLASIRNDGDETLPPPEIEQRNEETDETGNKAGMVPSSFDKINSSDSPLGANLGVVDIVVSSPKTWQTCDDEFGVHGRYVEKVTMIDNCSKEPDCLLRDGIIAGQKVSSDEKLCNSETEKKDDVVDDDSLILKQLVLEEVALNAARQNHSSGSGHRDETSKAYKSSVLSPSDESNIHITVGDGSQRQESLLHDNALGNEETIKSNEDLENRNNGFDADIAFIKMRVQELKELVERT